jgi:HEAT repeat protein
MTEEKQLHEMSLDELIAVFERDSQGDEGWADYYVETAATILSYRGDSGVRYLLDYLPSADTAHTEAILIAFRDHELEREEVREAMLSALDDSRPQVLYAAIWGLQGRGVRHLLPRIEPLVQHESSAVRSAAFRYLARLYPEIALNYVDALHADPNWSVREQVLTELEDTHDERFGELAVPYALKSLDDPHPYVREDAAMLLEDALWSEKTSQELIAGLTDSDSRIRASALRASAHNALDFAPKAIAAGLEDPERVVQLNALDELFEIYRDNQNEPLLELPDASPWLTDDDPVMK